MELVRSIGLAGLVRPATVAAGQRHAAGSATGAPGPAEPTDGALALAEPAMPSHAAVPGSFPLHGEPDRILPVAPQLRELMPNGGLRRGSSIAVTGAATLLIGLLSEASRAGSWCAVVGLPTFGAVAAAEAGTSLERVALVPYPGPEWTEIVGALLDGFDIVVAAPPGPVASNIAGRLAARARQRGGVLITYGQMPGADIVLEAIGSRWSGLDRGSGRLLERELTVVARGRGAAARARQATFLMPSFTAMNTGWIPRVDGRSADSDSRPNLTLVASAPDIPDDPIEAVERQAAAEVLEAAS
jgi:hypothetical protein